MLDFNLKRLAHRARSGSSKVFVLKPGR
jgi:hypothetical protein